MSGIYSALQKYWNSKDKIALLTVESRYLQIWLRWIWDKTTECHILLLGDSTQIFYQLRSSALLELHPPIWCEHKYWNSCLMSLSKWSAVSCCINSSGIKNREYVVSVISITSAF